MSAAETQIIRVGCPAHNRGGRRLMRAQVKDGVIVRLETDDRPDSVATGTCSSVGSQRVSRVPAS